MDRKKLDRTDSELDLFILQSEIIDCFLYQFLFLYQRGMRVLLGSIEAGGTKFVCAVGNEDYRTKNI
ncbi:hypothetical protein, partial [Oenococcus oeni]|uniref:hypothetical protein n=1 Tax=Oenococcus oeni TaxID=1247 RepID=UPI001C5B1B5B